jgi:hypothetical protein
MRQSSANSDHEPKKSGGGRRALQIVAAADF